MFTSALKYVQFITVAVALCAALGWWYERKVHQGTTRELKVSQAQASAAQEHLKAAQDGIMLLGNQYQHKRGDLADALDNEEWAAVPVPDAVTQLLCRDTTCR